MDVYTCGNPDCHKRSTEEEIDEAAGYCPHCGSDVLDFSHSYKPRLDEDDVDPDEEPILREW